MSVRFLSRRASITGPFAEITVGSGSSAVVFNLPKELLCNSSTYFKAALNNGFSETATQKIALEDEDPEVFRTYAVYLFQHELRRESIEAINCIERHLFQVYIFADKRGIVSLANDVVTMISSYWITECIDLKITKKFLALLPTKCTLYELTLDNLILESRAHGWEPTDWEVFCSHPTEIVAELFRREQAFSKSFDRTSHCFESICHYHTHRGEDKNEEQERTKCIEKTTRGRNLWDVYHCTYEQVEWGRRCHTSQYLWTGDFTDHLPSRSAITGPTAQIIVGSKPNIKTFTVHKELLCDSSTYFKAALNNGIVETKEQTITLDDEDPNIFTTFVLWLYESKLNTDVIYMGHETFQGHLFNLYVFADKRGIVNLANDTTTMLASCWLSEFVELSEVERVVPLISRSGKLYKLIMDNLLLEMRGGWGADDLKNIDLPKEMLIDLLSRITLSPAGFDTFNMCFQSICHYHFHGGQNVLSEEECVRRVEAGNNVFDPEVDLRQKVWGWDD
ncbi:unnamed protein product, partial [Aureobasidium uvarum]